MTQPLIDPPALSALLQLTGSDQATDALVRRFGSWEELSQASPYDLTARVGPWAGSLRVPAHCPELACSARGVRLLSRYHAEANFGDYPRRLLELAVPPALVSLYGAVPVGPLVAVGGSWKPGWLALSRARAAARAAVEQGYGVVAVLDGGCGSAAVGEALALGGVVLGVSGGDLEAFGADSTVVAEIAAGGGGVLSSTRRGVPWSQTQLAAAGSMAAVLGHVAVAADFGLHLGGGMSFVQEALAGGRRLIGFAPGVREVVPFGSSTVHVRGHRAVDALGRVDLPAGIGGIERAELAGFLGTPMVDWVVRSPGELSGAIAAGVAAG